MRIIPTAALLLAASLLTAASVTAQETFPYSNEFSSQSMPLTVGEWTLDTDDGILNYFRAGGTFSGTAVAEVAGAAAANEVVVSSWFTVRDSQGTGNPITIGFGSFSEASSLVSGDGDYYLTDWEMGGGGNARLRIIAFVNGATTTLGTTAVGKATVGEIYELRLTAVHNAGDLDLTFALFDESGSEIGSLTRTHANPITGEFFGLRNRTAGANHVVDLDYHVFSVGTEPASLPPPPVPLLVEITDLSPAPGTAFHTGSELSFTVSTQSPNTIDEGDIELYLNGALIPHNELAIVGASPSFDVSYNGLAPDTFYTAEVVAADNTRQTSRTWTFNTLTGTTGQVVEDVGLNMSTTDAIQGIVGVNSFTGALSEGGNVARITNATSPTTPTGPGEETIIGPNDVTTTITWDLAAHDPSVGEHRTLTQVDIWLAGRDPARTGYDGELAISNDGENFTTVPGTRVSTALPVLTDPNGHSLIRYFIDEPELFEEGFRYLRFISYGYNNLGEPDENRLRHPRIVEIDAFVTTAGPYITELTPGPGAVFYTANDGLHFAAEADLGNTIAPEDIQLFLNGEEVPFAELDIGGSASSRSVSFTGLGVNRFYTATAVVRDEERQTAHSWSFDTFSESAAVVIEATDYNFKTGETVCPGTPPATGGDYFNNPVPSTWDDGFNAYYPFDRANAYVDQVGAPGVDYQTGAALDPNHNQYRLCDPVGTAPTGDVLRQKFEDASIAAGFEVPDFHLHRVQSGEWFNYTRDFPAGVYRVYLRASATSGSPRMRLDQVTSDATVGSQTTAALGEFIPGATGDFGYIPLTDDFGQPLILSLDGQETVRLTALSANNNFLLNYMVFVPATEIPPSVVSVNPAHEAADVLSDATIEVELADGSSPLDLASVRLFLNDVEVSANVVPATGGATVSFTPGNMSPLEYYKATARVEFNDQAGSGPYTVDWTFTVKATFPFLNDFTITDAFPVQLISSGSNASYTLDTANGTFNYTKPAASGTSGTKNPTASLPIGGAAGQDFVMFSRFTLNGIDAAGQGGPSNNGIRIAFGVLSHSGNFLGSAGAYYLVHWHAGGGTNEGRLRIEAIGNSTGFTEGTGDNIGTGISGNEYDFMLEGVYVGGVLEMTFSVYDITNGGALMGSVTATDTEPLTGEHFGLRHSTSHTNHGINASHHNFAVVHLPGDLPALSIARDAGQIVLTWDDPDAVLETAFEVSGPWTDVEGATSPHLVDPGLNLRQFFRLRLGD